MNPVVRRARHPISLNQVIVVSAVTQLLVIMDSSVLSVAIPSIGEELDFTPVSLQLIVNAYTVALAGAILLMGRIADTFGRRRVLTAGIILFGVASVICGLAPVQEVFVAGRVLQGLASAALVGSNLALIIECFTQHRPRLTAIGLWGAAGGAGGALGTFIGGLIVEYSDWRLALLINVPITVYLLFVPMRRIGKDRPPLQTQTDFIGGLLLAGTMVALLLAIMTATAGELIQAASWAAASVITGVGFGVREKNARAPLLSLNLLRVRGVLAPTFVMLLAGGSMASAFYLITLQLQLVETYTPLYTGIAFLPLSFAIFAGGILGPKILHYAGARATLVIGTLATGSGLVCTAVLFGQGHPLLGVGATPVFGVGVAFILTSAASAATSTVSEADAGYASGMISTIQHFGAVIILATLVLTSGKLATLCDSASTFVFGLAGAALACVAACFIALAVPRERKGSDVGTGDSSG